MLRTDVVWGSAFLRGWALAATLVLVGEVTAAPPWASLMPFKRIDADPKKTYELGEAHGPWMVLCSSFAGPSAQQQAHDLAMELRQRYQLEAVIFQQCFDFSQPTDGLGFDQYGGKKQMRYLHNSKFDEVAVLVGHFPSVDDPALAKTLEKIKYAKPQVLSRENNKTTQRMAVFREYLRNMAPDQERKSKGPMGSAFVTRNPLLPEEFFAAKGLDPFLVEINQDLPNSLLKNPARYTVRVASFRGVDTLNKEAEFEKRTTHRKGMAKIDAAALKASKMCAALRAKGVEAYEFHDRTESIVTVGSFDEVGQPRQDGKVEINPAVHTIMNEYGPVKEAIPGTGVANLNARTLNGIPFDPQPLPVEVPRATIGAAYNQSNSLLR